MLAVRPSPCFGGQHPPQGRAEKLNGLHRWESICLGNKGELRSGDKRRRANSWLLVHHPCRSLPWEELVCVFPLTAERDVRYLP